MKPEVLEPGLPSLDALRGFDAFCLLVTEDERPLSGAAGYLDWRLCGALSRVLKNAFFSGTPDERLLMPSEGRVPVAKVFAVGLGKSRNVTLLGLEHALIAAAVMLEKAGVGAVALALPALPQLSAEAAATVLRRAFCDAFKGARVGVLADLPLRQKLSA